MLTIRCRVALLGVALGASVLSFSGQTTENSPTPDAWKQSAFDISQSDLTGKKDALRQERSALFDDKRPDARKLDSAASDPVHRQGSFPPYFVRTPAIPVPESDAVIVGTVKSVQPYLSNDHTHLYTEFSIAVEQTIKDISNRATQGEVIPIVVPGGKMRLQDGRVIEEKPFTNFTIAVGSRYVFFLRYNNTGQNFAVAKSWELKNGAVIPTAHEDRMDAREGKSEYASMSEQSFIQAVHAAADPNASKWK
jgi:hypothetical protein